jgi:hypothetical protein
MGQCLLMLLLMAAFSAIFLINGAIGKEGKRNRTKTKISLKFSLC